MKLTTKNLTLSHKQNTERGKTARSVNDESQKNKDVD